MEGRQNTIQRCHHVLTRWQNTSTHLHEGEALSVNPLLSSRKWLFRLCLGRLHSCFVLWTRPLNTSLLLGTLADLRRSKSELMAENALLRQQLIMLKRQVKRPSCTKADRLLLILLVRMVRTWKQALFIVQPDTLLRWHRQGFRLFWRQKSKASLTQAKVSAETIALIKEMAKNNRLWGAERIRGELLKLDIRICKRTIQKYMRGRTHTSPNRAKLADVSAQSWGRDLGL
jgi:putative transposase